METINSNDLIKTKLEYARSLYLHASSLRMKNFNYFLIILAGSIALHSNIKSQSMYTITYLAGMLLGMLFILLDMRGKKLLLSASSELIKIEEAIDINIIKKRDLDTFQLMSHTFVYRAVYLTVSTFCIVMLIKNVWSIFFR